MMKEAVAYAHLRNVKVYVTMNNFAQKAFIDRKGMKFLALQDSIKQKYMVVNVNENVEVSVNKLVAVPQAKQIRIYFN